MTRQRCETCRYCLHGECRRYPPPPRMEVVWDDPDSDEVEQVICAIESDVPDAPPNHWCGEWVPPPSSGHQTRRRKGAEGDERR